VDEPTVFIDAYNVMRSRWPNLEEARFVRLCRAWAEREGCRLLIVFDGDAPGDRIGEWPLDERTSVAGTGGGTADEWIVHHAERLAGEGRRLWLVTSDRELRERAAPWIERTIGGGAFAGHLQALEREDGR
jgi:predicted RNA-binding protein with PIN domain